MATASTTVPTPVRSISFVKCSHATTIVPQPTALGQTARPKRAIAHFGAGQRGYLVMPAHASRAHPDVLSTSAR